VAWALAPARLATAVASAHTNLTYSAPTPLQAGIAAALREEDGSFGGVAQLFGANFELLATALREHRGLTVCDAQGGYFLVADAGVPDIDFVRPPLRDRPLCERRLLHNGLRCCVHRCARSPPSAASSARQ